MKDSSDEREMGEVVWEGGGVTLLTLLGYLLKLMKCQHASVARVFVMHTEQNINLNSLLKLFSHSSPSSVLPFFPFFSSWLLLRFSFFVGCQVVSANLAFGRWKVGVIWNDVVVVPLLLLAICNKQSLDHGLKASRERERQREPVGKDTFVNYVNSKLTDRQIRMEIARNSRKICNEERTLSTINGGLAWGVLEILVVNL